MNIIYPNNPKPLDMVRNIPSMKSRLLRSLKEQNPEAYESAMVGLETQIEKQLIEMFWKMGIQASVKTNKYSLPIHMYAKHIQKGSWNSRHIDESPLFYREIFKEILSLKCSKIRFYVFIEVKDSPPCDQIEYLFYYYTHPQN